MDRERLEGALMAGVRSPNYPNHGLMAALELVRKVYEKDGRNKIAKATLAKHLGHDAVSGPALGKIGAMRAYGLISGLGDSLHVTPDAIAALKAPEGSAERKEALLRLAYNPGLYKEIQKHYPSRPSREALVYWLATKGFSDAAASIAATCYLETLEVVEEVTKGDTSEIGIPKTTDDNLAFVNKREIIESVPSGGQESSGERVLVTGMLSRAADFKLIVRGPIGVKEIERLIAKLQLEKEILADDVPSEE